MKKYIIFMKDYSQMKIICMFESYNKREIFSMVEELSYFFTEKEQGSDLTIYEKSKSHKYGKCPYGVFIAKNGNLPGLTIFRKKIDTGIIYNTYSVKKLAAFGICEVEEKIEQRPEIYNFVLLTELCRIKRENWDAIHKYFRKLNKKK